MTNPLETIYKPLNERKVKYHLAICFLLADVMFMKFDDINTDIKRSRNNFRHDVKKRFNSFRDTLRRAQKETSDITTTVWGLEDEKQEAFLEDSQDLREIIEIIVQKTYNNPDNVVKVKALISNLRNDNFSLPY